MVYITRTAKKAELAPRLKEEFGAVQGVSRVIGPPNLRPSGSLPRTSGWRTWSARRDRFAFDGATEGQAVSNVPAGSTPGAHGYINTDNAMNAVSSLPGRDPARREIGFDSQSGCRADDCALLGLEMKNIEGKVLTEILG